MFGSTRWRSAAAVALVVAGCAMGPLMRSSAATSHVHLLTPYQLSAPSAGNLVYHGGPVMRQTSTTYAIFWLPPGAHVRSGYQALVERYFSDIGGSTLYNNDTQYFDGAGHIVNSSSLGGTWTDTAPYPAVRIQDAQIQAEVVKAMTTNHWTGGLTHDFFVYLGNGQDTCIQPGTCIKEGGFCAYHGFFSSGGSTVLYANMPYPNTFVGTPGDSCILRNHSAGLGPNHNPPADGAVNITSHEHMETVTDPMLNAWYDASGFEIGDKCAWTFGTIGPDGGNITMNSNRYIVQQEWDNHTSGCTLAGP